MNGSDAAFPAGENTTAGVSIRTYIATAALQGLLSQPTDTSGEWGPVGAARKACSYADTLIAELNK